MTNTFDRWVLAFDGSCRVCRNMSRAVADASAGKLEVIPLAHPDVREWREQAFGANPVWAPTLLHVRSGQVRAWVGIPLGFTLVRHLGIRSTLAVLGALGPDTPIHPPKASRRPAPARRSHGRDQPDHGRQGRR